MSMDYPIVIAPLSDEQGGGFIGSVPDLLGCMSDGETREEALANTVAAIDEWIATAKDRGMEIPEPGSFARRVQREQSELIAAARDAINNIAQIDERLESLETKVQEIQELYEHESAWVRFTAIVGTDPRDQSHRYLPL